LSSGLVVRKLKLNKPGTSGTVEEQTALLIPNDWTADDNVDVEGDPGSQ
jgi:hypothetical protein